jgi:hypothetical protein
MILAGENGSNRRKPCPSTTSYNTNPTSSGMVLNSGLPVRLLHWTTNFKKSVFVLNMLFIYLFASMKLEKEHKKIYLVLVLKLCYRYDILRTRLKYYTER